MTIKHMQIFIVVYQQMNITKAAEILHMTQPAVSRAIQELESNYKIRLFERIKHRLFRNDAADAFYARAIHIVESFEHVETEFNNWNEFETLRVGASITLGNYFLPTAVRNFKEGMPNTVIRVKVSNTGAIRRMLLDNQIDLALVEGKIDSEYLREDRFGEGRMVLILPPDHPLLQTGKVGLREIAQYPLLMREPGSAGRTFLDTVFDLHEIEVTPLWESASTQAIVRAVASGFGVSILPQELVLADIQSGAVATKDVEDASFTRGNYIVWHRQKYLSDTAKAFIRLCHQLQLQKTDGWTGRSQAAAEAHKG